MRRYRIEVTGDDLTFCSAHFLTFGGGASESLHGHNYRVTVGLGGELDAHRMVHDFVDLRQRIRRLLDALDHRVLLPSKSPSLEVTRGDGAVCAVREEKEYRFPESDVVLLPVENTTAEMLASHIADALAEELVELGAGPGDLVVELEEGPGQVASVSRPVSRNDDASGPGGGGR